MANTNDERTRTLYNGACAAQRAAAQAIADERMPGARGAWLNEFGIFAYRNGCAVVLGTAAEAAPFVGLTRAALASKETE